MKVLLIEDHPKTVQSLKQGLEEHQMEVDFAYDGYSGKLLAERNKYDVIVSDIIIPYMNGLELCKYLRNIGIKTPVLMLSALDTTEDKVVGLDAGADDYLVKPFEFRELLARIRALSRRSVDIATSSFIFAFEDLELNLHTKKVTRGQKIIELTPKEFSLLEYLIKNKEKVVTKAEIFENVWDINFDTGTNVVEVYVNYLRNKLDKGFDRKLIHTKFGIGYILKVD
ncbi:MAG TPA: response regulator transcription factor [Saprospiraceae bacterium]|nr:response regulator transcription factor [Saprospiraceae bacterium]